jgi:hypothetical protein
MVAVIIAFPLLMLGTLVYVALAAHDETAIGGTSEGQTGCVACAGKRSAAAATRQASMDESIAYENELIAA